MERPWGLYDRARFSYVCYGTRLILWLSDWKSWCVCGVDGDTLEFRGRIKNKK